ncbi:DUF2330 domain-containing protein [Kamptonema cortianum]|nr:DUF2330 domain-containing protein [Kamptonema cortianum]
MKPLRSILSLLLIGIILLAHPANAFAFCGFYVAKADAKLYNQASQVIIARDGDRTILTMANDYQGDVEDFALVVPVPVVLQEEQVQIGDSSIIERLDAFSAPRLVEYFDSDPCTAYLRRDAVPAPMAQSAPGSTRGGSSDEAFGVTVESRFSVGEYDIAILSARESNGLENWLNHNGYRIPRGANQVLHPYIRQGMKFFVAKVNLGEFEKAGIQLLRPLMIAYESPKFMLPIRLGTINSQGEQDLIVYILSRQGQAEVTNYRTVKIPSNAEIPLFVKNEFSEFYKAMFQNTYQREGRNVAFLEYAWDTANCDPCSADPPSLEELKKAGVFWLDNNSNRWPNVFISRIHVRYTRDKFPEDLTFQTTANQQLFQGRYVLRHPFTGEVNCSAGYEYKRMLARRFEEEAQTLAKLTNWNIQDIRRKMNVAEVVDIPWWRRIWPLR